MTEPGSIAFWQRFQKSAGCLGGFSFLLVIFASRTAGGFDWTVFGLSGLAVLLAWSQNWILVPVHLRQMDADKKEWQRYLEGDWRFVSAVSALSGTELDDLRAIFRDGDDARARQFSKQKWPKFSDEDEQEFLRFFNDEFMDTISSYVDENGRLRPFD